MPLLQLTLLRHAKAEPADTAPDDIDRVLAEKGREDAPRMGRALAEAGAAPELALVSTARRTRETWDLVQPAFPAADVRILDSLYLADASTLMSEAERAGAERVMVVAHNPGLHELASRLAFRNNTLEAKLRAKFPTAAAALFARKAEDASWRLSAFLTPKDV